MSDDIKKYINLFESTREVEYTEYTPEVVSEEPKDWQSLQGSEGQRGFKDRQVASRGGRTSARNRNEAAQRKARKGMLEAALKQDEKEFRKHSVRYSELLQSLYGEKFPIETMWPKEKAEAINDGTWSGMSWQEKKEIEGDLESRYEPFDYSQKESVEEDHDMPASPEEAEMAGDQAEFIKYAIDEIKDSIERGDDFPEWFQNKLSGVYTTMKSLHGWMEGDSRNDADDEYSAKFDEIYGKDKDILDNLSIRKEDKEFDLDDLNNVIDSL